VSEDAEDSGHPALSADDVTAADEIAAGREPSAEAASRADAPPPRPWQPVVRRWWLPITLLTVALEAGVLVRLGLHWSTLPIALFAATAVVLAVADFAVLRLPNVFTEPTGLAVFAALVVQALAEHRPHHLLTELYCGLAVALFYQALRLLSRGGLGAGDVKVGAVAGALLGARGVQPVFNGMLVAYLTTLVIALAMMTRRRKQFPYGPGILFGALLVLLV
jgi:leader peptidase (prepilin peptidase)/N-methyltransferase